jgi:hypothetical protein
MAVHLPLRIPTEKCIHCQIFLNIIYRIFQLCLLEADKPRRELEQSAQSSITITPPLSETGAKIAYRRRIAKYYFGGAGALRFILFASRRLP